MKGDSVGELGDVGESVLGPLLLTAASVGTPDRKGDAGLLV